MIVEFRCDGKTYTAVVGGVDQQPPARLTLAFRPCAFKPPFLLDLDHRGRDSARGVELYEAREDQDD